MIVDDKTLRQYKKEFNFFQTPPKIADKMGAFLAEMGRDVKILEPSAGLGALAHAAEKYLDDSAEIVCCEIQDEFIKILESKYKTVKRDFLDFHPGPVFDGCIMNPPFRNHAAEKHVDHAWDCLKPGGRLVALVGKGAVDSIDEEFYGHVFHKEKIVKGFKETSVDTFLYLIHKPLY